MGYTVKLLPSGHTFRVAEGQKILRAGLEAGISMPYSCRMGTCSTCRGRVISGKLEFGNVLPAYLTEEQRAKGYALLCQALPLSDLVLEVKELPLLAPSRRFPAMLKRFSLPRPDVAIIELRLPLNINFSFAAGQYANVLLPNGEFRCYSIANPPLLEGVIDLHFHIRHIPGGLFTDELFGGMKERRMFQLEAPLGTFFLREDSTRPIIMLASGTGYAPIRAVLLHAFNRKSVRPIALYWGARTKSDLYLIEEPLKWSEVHPNFRFVPVLSEPLPEDGWTGRTGFVHQAVMEDFPVLSHYQVYACGVPAMVNAARRDFARIGLPPTEFFADSFVSQADLALSASQLEVPQESA